MSLWMSWAFSNNYHSSLEVSRRSFVNFQLLYPFHYEPEKLNLFIHHLQQMGNPVISKKALDVILSSEHPWAMYLQNLDMNKIFSRFLKNNVSLHEQRLNCKLWSKHVSGFRVTGLDLSLIPAITYPPRSSPPVIHLVITITQSSVKNQQKLISQ